MESDDMDQVAFITGGTFVYWSSIILALAALTAATMFICLYLWKSQNATASAMAVPLSIVLSMVLGRLVHWYCFTDSYDSLETALTDFSHGGYALAGIFAGCILTACLLRIFLISKNLPQMLDCMALAGGVAIAVGRLSFFFNSSDRGMILPDSVGLPFAYAVTNSVSGAAENRLATFLLQAIATGVIVLALLVWLGIHAARKHPVKDGDTAALFLAAYGGCQIVFDSTRYDSLFLRSNGFISIVQILGLCALVVAVVLFSVRMVKTNGLRWYHFLLWVGILTMFGAAGYMEYYVQRHGDQAALAYGVMAPAVLAAIGMTISIRWLAEHPRPVIKR